MEDNNDNNSLEEITDEYLEIAGRWLGNRLGDYVALRYCHIQ